MKDLKVEYVGQIGKDWIKELIEVQYHNEKPFQAKECIALSEYIRSKLGYDLVQITNIDGI